MEVIFINDEKLIDLWKNFYLSNTMVLFNMFPLSFHSYECFKTNALHLLVWFSYHDLLRYDLHKWDKYEKLTDLVESLKTTITKS